MWWGGEENISKLMKILGSQTHIWLSFNQGKIQFMVNVLDSGFILDPTLELHLDPLLVREDVGIGNNKPILRYYEPRATGCRNILTAERRPVSARQQLSRRRANQGIRHSPEAWEPGIYETFFHHSFLRHFTFPCLFSFSPHVIRLCVQCPGRLLETGLRADSNSAFPGKAAPLCFKDD